MANDQSGKNDAYKILQNMMKQMTAFQEKLDAIQNSRNQLIELRQDSGNERNDNSGVSIDSANGDSQNLSGDSLFSTMTKADHIKQLQVKKDN